MLLQLKKQKQQKNVLNKNTATAGIPAASIIALVLRFLQAKKQK